MAEKEWKTGVRTKKRKGRNYKNTTMVGENGRKKKYEKKMGNLKERWKRSKERV